MECMHFVLHFLQTNDLSNIQWCEALSSQSSCYMDLSFRTYPSTPPLFYFQCRYIFLAIWYIYQTTDSYRGHQEYNILFFLMALRHTHHFSSRNTWIWHGPFPWIISCSYRYSSHPSYDIYGMVCPTFALVSSKLQYNHARHWPSRKWYDTECTWSQWFHYHPLW